MSPEREIDWDQALALLQRQQREVMFAFSPQVVREELAERPELATAALALIRGVFVDGRKAADGERLEPLLEGAAMTLAAAGGYEQAMLEVAFRIDRTVNYRTLVPLLRIVISDDEQFERAVIDALASDDDEVAARAVAIQYSAWGFPDRFVLSVAGRDAVVERIEALRGRRSDAVDAALGGYVVPPAG